MDLSKYVDLFLSEGREHVAELSAALGELEHDPSSKDGIAAAFRAVHSVKGMAAAMAYSDVSDRAHSLEFALEAIRSGEDAVTPSLVAHLIEETDALARDIEAAVRPSDAPAIARITRSSHVRVRASRLDSLMDLVGELEIARGRLERELPPGPHRDAGGALYAATKLLRELREQVIAARMVPVGQVFERFPRLVRETARALGKDVDFTLDGADIELDRSMLDRIGDPVMHLLRNSLDHGIEQPDDRERAGKSLRGRLTLTAQRESGYVLVRVADDGSGVDRKRVLDRGIAAGYVDAGVESLDDSELLRVLVRPGFSTTDSVTAVSGRGVGLDVVEATVRALGGTIELKTVAGRGTAITLRMPVSVSIVRALIARVGDEKYAVPFTHVNGTVELEAPDDVERWSHSEIDGAQVPVISLRERFGVPRRSSSRVKGVTVTLQGRRAALVVDEFLGQQDIVVKQFDAPRVSSAEFAGATVLADGAPALIIDVNSLI